MPTVGKPEFNWDAPCLEQECNRWQHVITDNFVFNKTDGKGKACLLRGWIGDKDSRTCTSTNGLMTNGRTMRYSCKDSRKGSNPKVGTREINTSLS